MRNINNTCILFFIVFARQEHNLRKEGVERKGKETWKFTYNASFP